MRRRIGTIDHVDEEATALVLDALHDIRTNVRLLVAAIVDDEEGDGPGEEEEA